jgi:hypothetical protein
VLGLVAGIINIRHIEAIVNTYSLILEHFLLILVLQLYLRALGVQVTICLIAFDTYVQIVNLSRLVISMTLTEFFVLHQFNFVVLLVVKFLDTTPLSTFQRFLFRIPVLEIIWLAKVDTPASGISCVNARTLLRLISRLSQV